MTLVMTREQAAAAVTAQTEQRDGIQANLLELDGSFGKRLLEGASLAGETKQRWDAGSAELTTMWEIFTAYSAVVDRAAELVARVRRPSSPELPQVTALLTGTPVRLSRAPVPLGRRDLTDSGRLELTLRAAVATMTNSFASVAAVVTAAENVWNAASDGLREVAAELTGARSQASGLGDDALGGALAAAEAELASLRVVVNCDPLALWQDGQVDLARLDRLRTQAAAAAMQIGELARLRGDAQRRIAVTRAAVAAARAAWQDAASAQDRAAAKIAASALPPLPPAPDLDARLASLTALQAAGRWPRLASELDLMDRQAALATRDYHEAEQVAVALLRRRDELRGLLEAYQAKAASLGAVEDIGLTTIHDEARALLWTAPCDLATAADAVTRYQAAVLALRRQGRQP